MPNFTFQTADRLFWHDKIMAATVLRLIPFRVLPYHVTMFRFFATPLVVVLMLEENYLWGLLAFLVVAFTDVIDGSLARTRNQITDWGKIYDPLADKILIGSMVFIIILRYIDFWTALLIMAIEIIIIIVGWIRKKRGLIVQANIWGKIKMSLQVLGVVMLLLSIIFNIEQILPFAHGTFYLAIAFAVVSLLTYGI